jgi:hypothetical protein
MNRRLRNEKNMNGEPNVLAFADILIINGQDGVEMTADRTPENPDASLADIPKRRLANRCCSQAKSLKGKTC